MNFKRIISIILSVLFTAAVLTACTKESTDNSNNQAQTQSLDYSDMFSSSDMETGYDEATAGAVTLADSGCVSKSESVKTNDCGVTITDAGTYIISGTLTNGSITVDADKSDKIRLIFDGVSVNCDTFAAVYVKQADKVFITLTDGSENKLSNKTGFDSSDDENNVDSVIFSKDDLTINGNGKLTISSTGGHGIVSKDDLIITGGDYSISADSHALSANDSVRVADGNFTLTSGKDTVVDNENGLIYGIASNSADINSYVNTVDDTMTVECDSALLGTGSIVNIVKDDVVVDSYKIVVFGDVNGDGWYDGMDAVTVSCIANGLLTKDQIGEAAYMAADCNHDGVVDEFDVAILNQAGVLLANVDQTKTQEELSADSDYVEYLNLIDQNPTIEEETQEPEQDNGFIAKLIAFIETILKCIVTLVNKIW